MKKKKITGLSLLTLIALICLIIFITPDVSRHFPDKSKVILASDGEIMHCFLNSEEQWCLPLQTAIPSKLKTAVLQYEDRWFYYHPGFNPAALIRGFIQNLTSGRIISGGSTLTMQVARIADPGKRTYWKKITEIFAAIKLEILYSKEEILQFYFENAPYGGNIRGIEAASMKYYRKKPGDLTWSEAATLTVLPNAPGLISPGKNQDRLIEKRNRLLIHLQDEGILSNNALQLSLQEPVPDRVYPLPQSAPHASILLKENRQDIVHSTIDISIQQRSQYILKQQMEFLKNQGINNCAAIICETESGNIRAYCGSQDFYDFEANGQVDGVRAPRSSGSTLKPFLYALAMDKGLILPQTLMKDIPSHFGSFAPENADRKYSGLVTAKDALIKSLNIPAVRLLHAINYENFHYFLRESGLTTIFRPPGDYGLTLIIGGAETRLDELTSLYRGLGRYGNFSPLNLVEKDHPQDSQQHLSAAACYLTLDILRNLNRPGNEYYWHQYTDQWPLAWKTGTSFGQRDAWAVGVNPQWTIGVWVGNFTGEGNPAISGAQSAGPILFDLFNALPKDNPHWFDPPLNEMDAVVICKETGFLAGKFCTERDTVLAPIWQKPLALCPYHKQIIVNDDETEAVCSLCWGNESHHAKIYTIYPPDVEKYLRQRGIYNSPPPKHRASCPSVNNLNTISITYPPEDSKLRIPTDIDGFKQKVTLKAAHYRVNSTIYWYLDNVFIGTTLQKHEMSITPAPGNHTLYLVDSDGNDSDVRFSVVGG